MITLGVTYCANSLIVKWHEKDSDRLLLQRALLQQNATSNPNLAFVDRNQSQNN